MHCGESISWWTVGAANSKIPHTRLTPVLGEIWEILTANSHLYPWHSCCQQTDSPLQGLWATPHQILRSVPGVLVYKTQRSGQKNNMIQLRTFAWFYSMFSHFFPEENKENKAITFSLCTCSLVISSLQHRSKQHHHTLYHIYCMWAVFNCGSICRVLIAG